MTRSEDTPGIQGEGQRPDSNSSLRDTQFDFWGDTATGVDNLHVSVSLRDEHSCFISIFDTVEGVMVAEGVLPDDRVVRQLAEWVHATHNAPRRET